MAQQMFRLPASHRHSATKGGDSVPGGFKPKAPVLKRNTSRASILASAAIQQAKKQRPFRSPSEEFLRQIAYDSLAAYFACDRPSGSMRLSKLLKVESVQTVETAVQEVQDVLKTKVEELSSGPFIKLPKMRNILFEAAKQTVAAIAARLPFRLPSPDLVDMVAGAVAKTRWPSKTIKHFDRVLLTYCGACLGFSGRDVVQRYLHDHIRRNLESLKSGLYIRMTELYEIMDGWAKEEVGRIEDLLINYAEHGKPLPKNQSPRGFDVIEIVIRYGRTRRCYLIVEQDTDKLCIKALKSSAKYRRNQRKRFNRNARSFCNVPKLHRNRR